MKLFVFNRSYSIILPPSNQLHSSFPELSALLKGPSSAVITRGDSGSFISPALFSPAGWVCLSELPNFHLLAAVTFSPSGFCHPANIVTSGSLLWYHSILCFGLVIGRHEFVLWLIKNVEHAQVKVSPLLPLYLNSLTSARSSIIHSYRSDSGRQACVCVFVSA